MRGLRLSFGKLRVNLAGSVRFKVIADCRIQRLKAGIEIGAKIFLHCVKDRDDGAALLLKYSALLFVTQAAIVAAMDSAALTCGVGSAFEWWCHG